MLIFSQRKQRQILLDKNKVVLIIYQDSLKVNVRKVTRFRMLDYDQTDRPGTSFEFVSLLLFSRRKISPN